MTNTDNTDEIFENKHERNDFIIALVVIAVFSLFVYMIYNSGSTKVLNTPQDTVNVSTVNTNKNTLENNNSNANEVLDVTSSNIETEATTEAINVTTEDNTNSLTTETNTDTTTLQAEDLANNSNIAQTNTNEEDNSPGFFANILNSITGLFATNSDTDAEDTLIENTTDTIENNSSIENTAANVVENANEAYNTATTTNDYEEASQEVLETATATIKENVTTYTEEVIENTTAAATTAQSNYNSNTTASTQNTSDCTIIVGAFRNENNLGKMLQKIENNGYTATQGVMKNGMYYAGVPVDCNNRAGRRSKMNALNSIFNIESWLYKQ